MRRVAALGIWAYLVWLLLTWTVTVEQQLAGVLVAIAVGVSMSPLGNVAAPWRLLDARRFVGGLRLIAAALGRIVRANIQLARRIWAPSRPLSSGMVIVPTRERTDGGLAVIGLITSLIVDNQLVDIDRERNELQYHAVAVPPGSGKHPEDEINAPVERLLAPIVGQA